MDDLHLPYHHPSDTSSQSSPRTYLQQLAASISSPVPDLASTLTTPEALPHRRSSVHSERTAPNAANPSSLIRDDYEHREQTSREPEVTTTLNTMQSESDRGQAGRNRLRTFLQAQQNRQSLVNRNALRSWAETTQSDNRPSRSSGTSTGHAEESVQHLPHDILGLDSERSALSTLATAIADVGRDSYSTRGSAPARQRLYDWATSPTPYPESGGRTSAEDIGNSNIQDTSLREVERALHDYRAARAAFRSDVLPGSDIGTVPTVSSLRAYWAEEMNAGEPPRLTTQRRTLQWPDPLRESDSQDQRHGLARPSMTRPSEGGRGVSEEIRSSSSHLDAKERIKNTIHYLSQLRNTTSEGGLHLARSLNLDALYECEEANAASDLPLLIDTLPKPQPSSWLAPGMTWHGLQSTSRHQQPASAAPLRNTRAREQPRASFRALVARQALAEAQIRIAQNAESGRYLSSLTSDPDGRWGFSRARYDHEPPRPYGTNGNSNPTNESSTEKTDHWPVTVTIHSVDYEKMELTGTMRASQIPDRSFTSIGEISSGRRSMESFFEGEIIDFRNHSLETEGSKRNYKGGGLDTDAEYWARIGPFREAIKKQASSHHWDSSTWEEKLKTGDEKHWDLLKAAERETRERWAEKTMMRCLANQRWLREKLGSEWVLMRWKGMSPRLSVTCPQFFPSTELQACPSYRSRANA
jgi:hypothetical protein